MEEREKTVVKGRHLLQESNEPQIMSDADAGVPASSVLFTLTLFLSALSMGTNTILLVNTATSSAALSCLSALYPWEKREEPALHDTVSKQIYFKERSC